MRDAEMCATHAEEDALILFHDLAAPAVGAALDRMHELGWRTVVYRTVQIIGATWRGGIALVDHTPTWRWSGGPGASPRTSSA